MIYKDDLCNYWNYLFHESVKEYLKDGGEADKTIANWKKWNKTNKDFPKIKRKEIKIIKSLKAFKPAMDGDLTFAMILPSITNCPHMLVDLDAIMQTKCKYLINVKTLELKRK